MPQISKDNSLEQKAKKAVIEYAALIHELEEIGHSPPGRWKTFLLRRRMKKAIQRGIEISEAFIQNPSLVSQETKTALSSSARKFNSTLRIIKHTRAAPGLSRGILDYKRRPGLFSKIKAALRKREK